VVAGQVVGRDRPPTHPVTNGPWTDTLELPATAVGQPLTFRAVVHTRRGTIRLDWPITVQNMSALRELGAVRHRTRRRSTEPFVSDHDGGVDVVVQDAVKSFGPIQALRRDLMECDVRRLW
jgi:hypothetical protein